ncbi:hypothetical protein DPM19_19860 [Actinomadura craniellae]|uniref:DUF1579 domain-containing protein n=1 Tax=Actinomadura craniellae TaxID=2231787 RepID=A0A365H2K3_9ACTN|nr:hypothetical protein [Actinomadura craniellae]RAY13334.1 hypothetical protein DPM19_19860 [Actinomadura craniellae]
MAEHSTDAQLAALDRLVGTWRITGGSEGTVTYRWMEGGFFLIQEIDLGEKDGERTKGIEMIGRLRPYGAEEPSEHIVSRYYSGMGETLDYVYEMDGDTLTIWAVEKGSPAYYRGTFSADGNTLSGRWTYPGGGGYESIATRIG